MIRPLMIALSWAGLAAAAAAAPTLRAEVAVVGPIVTAGDMFEDAGTYAEEPLFRAPLPGTSGIVGLEAVRKAARAIGLTEFDAEGVMRVRVTRDAVPVDETMLRALVADDLRRRGIIDAQITAAVSFEQRPPAYNAEARGEPVRLSALRFVPETGVFTARFVIAGQDAPIDLGGRVDLMIEAPHLAASLSAGTVLQEGDIEMRPVPLRTADASGYARREDLVGKALMRQSRAGMLLRAADVGEPELVSRNDIVTVFFRSGPMTLTVKGQALGGGARGDSVSVLNLMSRKILTGIIVEAGAVEIVGSPLSVAGL